MIVARKLVTFDTGSLSRAERRMVKKVLEGKMREAEQEAPVIEDTTVATWPEKLLAKIASGKLSMPPHVGTGWEFASASPFAAADIPQIPGPVIGIEQLSGGVPFMFQPWNMYLEGVISSPNLLVKGSLRRGKSFIIKRLVTLLSLFGIYAINTSDIKGEHGPVAEAIGGRCYKVGSFGSNVRLNPLEAHERHHGESIDEHRSRLLATRQNVLIQIANLLAEGDHPITAAEKTILNWALDEVIRETNDHPTIRKVVEKINSEALLSARDGRFTREMANRLIFLFDELLYGGLAGMFEDEGNVKFDPESPYTVFDTYAMEKRGDLALAITQTITNSWVQATISNKGSGRRYAVIREEGWRDMKTKAALEAHELQQKLSGEYGIMMIMIVHEDGDFDTGDSEMQHLAQKIMRGYANQIVFAQDEAVLRNSVESGTLTRGEANLISGFSRGEFLLKTAGRSYHIDGKPTATEWEKTLFDTDRQNRVREEEHLQSDELREAA